MTGTGNRHHPCGNNTLTVGQAGREHWSDHPFIPCCPTGWLTDCHPDAPTRAPLDRVHVSHLCVCVCVFPFVEGGCNSALAISKATAPPPDDHGPPLQIAVGGAGAGGDDDFAAFFSDAAAKQRAEREAAGPCTCARCEALPWVSTLALSDHNTAHSSWCVVDGFACDVTQLLATHPGGTAVLKEQIGKTDSTDVFHNVPHSKPANALLHDMRVARVRPASARERRLSRADKADQATAPVYEFVCTFIVPATSNTLLLTFQQQETAAAPALRLAPAQALEFAIGDPAAGTIVKRFYTPIDVVHPNAVPTSPMAAGAAVAAGSAASSGSASPASLRFRLLVRRAPPRLGPGSSYFHNLQVGAIVRARLGPVLPPLVRFPDTLARPFTSWLLLGGGTGITVMVELLRALIAANGAGVASADAGSCANGSGSSSGAGPASVSLVSLNHTAEDVLLQREMEQLAAVQRPRVSCTQLLTQVKEARAHRRVSSASHAGVVAAPAAVEWVAGPLDLALMRKLVERQLHGSASAAPALLAPQSASSDANGDGAASDGRASPQQSGPQACCSDDAPTPRLLLCACGPPGLLLHVRTLVAELPRALQEQIELQMLD